MEIKTGPLAQRAMSSFALSIGTGLAFESVFKGRTAPYDPDRPIPNKVNITDYNELWINLSTLIRNIYSSVSSQEQASLMGIDLYLTLESEIETIRSLVIEDSNNRTKPIFYVSDHSSLEAKHPHARIRFDTTDKQRMFTAIKDTVLKEYLRRHMAEADTKMFDEHIYPTGPAKKVLILTNDAYDLLSYTEFGDLHLLESHTGLLKKRSLWYTKYHQGKELVRIPFASCFLQIFGDSVHFHPFPIKERLAIKEMADARNWTALTTRDRLLYCFTEMKDKALSEKLLAMLKE